MKTSPAFVYHLEQGHFFIVTITGKYVKQRNTLDKKHPKEMAIEITNNNINHVVFVRARKLSF